MKSLLEIIKCILFAKLVYFIMLFSWLHGNHVIFHCHCGAHAGKKLAPCVNKLKKVSEMTA